MNAFGSAASLLPSLSSGARILLVRLRSIGDIILLTPALRLLKGWRPDLQLSVVVESRFRELLDGNPNVAEVLDPGVGAGLAKIASRVGEIFQIRKRNFALCMNLHGGPTSRLLTRASGARWKVGFAHFRSPRLYDVLLPDARLILGQPSVHTAEHQASAFFYLGLPRQEIPRAQLFVSAENLAWWQEKKASLGIPPGRTYAILHPTALYATKQWPSENFARLGTYLEHDAGMIPVFSCGSGESAVLDAVQQAAEARIRRLEGSSLGEFAAALSQCQLFVGNDSGPAHLAAALSRPVVVIFSSSSSAIWGPWPRGATKPMAQVVQNPYDCNPCPGDRCYRFERPECILSVTYEQVRMAVEAVVGDSRAPGSPPASAV